jgi:hypothetical protein
MTFDVKDLDAFYVRFQLYGVGRRQAWTQPFFLRGGMAERRRELNATVNSRPRPQLNALRVSEKVDPSRPADFAGWKNVPESLLPYNIHTGFEPEVQTGVKAIVTPTHLIFNFRCEEPQMDKLVVKDSKNDRATYQDECVELFLDVENTGKHYYQIIANAVGKTAVSHHQEWDKDLRYNCSVQRGATGWNLYLSLLLDSLGPGVNTKAGSRFGFHVCRNHLRVMKTYVWAWVGSSNHSPERFGTLEL